MAARTKPGRAGSRADGERRSGPASQRRQLERLLRALARRGAVLRRTDAGLQLVDENGGVAGRFDAALVAAALSRGLLEPASEGQALGQEREQEQALRLAEAGRFALRRLLAGAEPFREQHQTRIHEPRRIDGEERLVMLSDGASPLGWLARRRDADGQPLIGATQLAAGERLARDFAYAGLSPRLTSNWAAGGAGAPGRQARSPAAEASDSRLAAQQRVRKALEAVGGDLADLLIDVCCLEVGLGELEKARNWPRRSGKLVLGLALDALARHYGLGSSHDGRLEARITHWGAADYRPRIDGGGA